MESALPALDKPHQSWKVLSKLLADSLQQQQLLWRGNSTKYCTIYWKRWVDRSCFVSAHEHEHMNWRDPKIPPTPRDWDWDWPSRSTLDHMYVATGGSSGKAYKCIETTAFWQRAMSMRDIRSSGDSTFYYAALCLWDAVGPIHDIHSHPHYLELFLIHNFQYCSSDLASVSHVGSKIKSPWKRNIMKLSTAVRYGLGTAILSSQDGFRGEAASVSVMRFKNYCVGIINTVHHHHHHYMKCWCSLLLHTCLSTLTITIQ